MQPRVRLRTPRSTWPARARWRAVDQTPFVRPRTRPRRRPAWAAHRGGVSCALFAHLSDAMNHMTWSFSACVHSPIRCACLSPRARGTYHIGVTSAPCVLRATGERSVDGTVVRLHHAGSSAVTATAAMASARSHAQRHGLARVARFLSLCWPLWALHRQRWPDCWLRCDRSTRVCWVCVATGRLWCSQPGELPLLLLLPCSVRDFAPGQFVPPHAPCSGLVLAFFGYRCSR